MKSLILLAFVTLTFAAQTLDLTKACNCTDFKVISDCVDPCLWTNNACKIKTCSDLNQTDCIAHPYACKWGTTCADYTPNCTELTNEVACDTVPTTMNCAWNGSCKTFTKCSDYVPGTTSCGSKSSATQKCQTNSAGTACENYTTTTCASFNTSANCLYSSTSLCIWGTACTDLSACTQLTASTTCGYYSQCFWATTCRAKACSDITVAADCTYVRAFDNKSGYLCKWDTTTTKCADAADTLGLTSVTCKTHTGFTYTWDGTKCNQCSGSSYGVVLGMLIGLLVLFI